MRERDTNLVTFVDNQLFFLVDHSQISHYADINDRVVVNSIHTYAHGCCVTR